MSVLDDATIICVPGVYKTSAVALQKPISAGSVSSLTFARASTGTRVNSAGLIESVATNVPRVDYLNDSCGAQLLEPARTNLLTYSEQFDNAAWSKQNTTISANTTTAPDGATTADKLVEDGATSSHFVTQTGVASANPLSFSVFLKADGSGRNATLGTNGGGVNNIYICVDLSDGSITESGAGTFTSDVISYGNGWYRAIINFDNTSLGVTGMIAGISNSATPGGRVPSYAGDGTSGYYIWGAQIETGGYPTSYIKTEASTVTRSAETLSQTGLATELGDSEGTIYFEASFSQSSSFLSLSDGANSNRIQFGFTGTNTFRLFSFVGGVQQAELSTGVLNTAQVYRFAIKYKADDFAIWVDGVEQAVDNTGNTYPTSTLTNFNFSDPLGSGNFYGNVKALHVWDRALTDAELEELTT